MSHGFDYSPPEQEICKICTVSWVSSFSALKFLEILTPVFLFVSTAAQKSVSASAPASSPSLASSHHAAVRRSATAITLELLRTQGLRGLYKGIGATLLRLDTLPLILQTHGCLFIV